NMVDRIFIGHIPEEGDLAITGLGLCFAILMLVSAFASLVGAGGAPRAAIAMGKNDKETAEKILGNCTLALLIIGVVLSVVLEIFAKPLLLMFGASQRTLPYALSYLRIYLAGSIFVLIALGLNPFITTQGYTKVAMKTVLIGAISNIILDPIFIFGFKMGVSGAALATIISQAISCIWVLKFLLGQKTLLKIRREYLRIEPKVLLPVLALGVSPFIMTATESLINITFNVSLQNYGGDVAVGAMTILASIMSLQFMPVQGLAQGAQPIISYNYGAKNMQRVKKAYQLLMVVCFAYTFLFWAFVMIWPEGIVSIFNKSPELLATTKWALRIYLATSGLFGIQMAVQQTFVALGQAKQSLFIACLRKIILLIPLILILPMLVEDKVFGVFLAEPVADLISVIVAASLFAGSIHKILSKE
ncbi:MAG: MATE family efflux transporter, partial [Agathobacter sp.]|nr:MATE family efflux transporter [Agathobacter sp.]